MIEYRDIEEKIESLAEREFDLRDIEQSIERVRASGALTNQTRALQALKAQTYELHAKARAAQVFSLFYMSIHLHIFNITKSVSVIRLYRELSIGSSPEIGISFKSQRSRPNPNSEIRDWN